MNKHESIALFNSLHPNFFEREDIRTLSENESFEEMLLMLRDYNATVYEKEFAPDISFGFYSGDIAKLKKCVDRVVDGWSKYFDENSKVYCGFVGSNVASFCIIENMGTHRVNGNTLKIGAVGCVGTLLEYRCRGIGLSMVNRATALLKSDGYDYSYIHYTAIAKWYEKLGYKTILRWTKNGLLVSE